MISVCQGGEIETVMRSPEMHHHSLNYQDKRIVVGDNVLRYFERVLDGITYIKKDIVFRHHDLTTSDTKRPHKEQQSEDIY